MKELIKSVKDFKIIPHNFKSSCSFKLMDVSENTIKIKLIPEEECELSDYKKDSNVEIFGTTDLGLLYFETKIMSKENDILEVLLTQDYSLIQRREYSRVSMRQGSVEFKDLSPDLIKKVLDISAGGIKLALSESLDIDKFYDIKITLSNNMKIDCSLKPIKITKDNDNYILSAKFVNLENMDRIILVQYAFKIKMEDQNKEQK